MSPVLGGAANIYMVVICPRLQDLPLRRVGSIALFMHPVRHVTGRAVPQSQGDIQQGIAGALLVGPMGSPNTYSVKARLAQPCGKFGRNRTEFS